MIDIRFKKGSKTFSKNDHGHEALLGSNSHTNIFLQRMVTIMRLDSRTNDVVRCDIEEPKECF